MLSNSLRRAALAAATAATTAVLLTACGDHKEAGHSNSGSGHTSPSAEASVAPDAGFNAQDVSFATDMIGHHRQAVDMASLAPQRAASTEVKSLAAKIQAAQQPEIDTMAVWLKTWGKPVPPKAGHGTDHGADSQMPGMMTAAQMDELNSATGAAFDKLFLEMMIAHHEGAVTMSNAEQSGGKNTEVKTLAGKIIADQTAEIAEMKQLQQGG